MVLPLDQMLKGAAAPASKTIVVTPAICCATASIQLKQRQHLINLELNRGSIMDQRRANAQRNDYQRQGNNDA